METRTYQISGRKEDLDILEKALRHIEYLGNIGASRNILIRIDGDGVGRINVKDGNGNKLSDERFNIVQSIEKTVIVGTYDIG
ncbi:TPA: hypothetical protein IAB29_00740 [Candidatus Ventrenecus stercoripullorum]|nr:hypothetical protein [Candidatus Ventrenecus stercoripullorum]